MPDYIYLLENRLSPAQRNAVEQVRQAAMHAGMTVFLAGGAVRDLTSGFPVRDLDFSVQGNALKLKKALEKSGGELWGEHEETRTLFFWFPGSVRVEVSSARREEYPKPGKPVYHWSTMLEDLRRRDFTVNAMAISLNEGSYGLLLDPLNGIADMEARHLRLVNNYGFLEDPSRMIRVTRLAARTGWEMDERTKARYDNAREEGIAAMSDWLRGYELEEIGHEEDALKILKALEAEGWMQQLFPAWTSAKADAAALEELHRIFVKLLMQGVHPDLSAAQMRLLTAKLAPKDLASLKKLLPCAGFVRQWEHLDEAAKEFSVKLTAKETSIPSATWKLIANYQPEPVLWLAFTSKSAPVQTRFKNFFEVWPEARQKIPTVLMSEMRITADLPDYSHLLNELFFALIDGKLETEEAMRAFLEPYSPPAPPPPVTIRRSRSRRAPKVEVEEEETPDIVMPSGYDEDDESGHEDEDEHEDHHADEDADEEEEHAPAKPSRAAKTTKPDVQSASKAAAKSAAKAVKAAAPAAQKAEPKSESKPAAKAAKPAPAKAAKPVAAAAKAASKPAAKAAPKPATKKAAPAPAKKVAKPAPAKAAKPVAKKAAKPAAKPVAKKVAQKSAAKAPAKPASKAPAKSSGKAAAKKKR
uniref:CCA tRNA nucleotidyltransferase n=1 Tax=Acidobacterium capsulatum TaxID=33075 RepID=A0A7V5CS62_9BACT